MVDFATMISMSSNNKGFTLIELLVVIAIIGILASVVLLSLSSAKEKAADASVKSNLNSARNSAALYYLAQGAYSYNSTGSYYSGNCLTGNTVFRMTSNSGTEERAIADRVADAIEVANQSGTAKQCRVSADRQTYMITIQLKSNGNYWCVDSSGFSGSIGSSLPASGITLCQ